ncbi:Asp23/Gls24 family envelope stress response protein [Aminivibrio sp.]|uniref:Asp23/Gls24 family envelope stress response protein n=1 Tax=Aminivibrio sp. TaxID=1872489 RepID=UPI001A4D07DB|nr:Asp23/Gls24 family envelope stress response protein [Aminivibrio sp.]MBL3539315.1 Asp23/Gls24 family envelope stress response protein [Aminivibrio sp.]
MDEIEQPEGGLSEMSGQGGADEISSVNGSIHISEEVIMDLAKKTLTTIPGVQPASPGIASKLGIGRKASDGIRVSVEDKFPPVVTVDVFLMVKYGLRIPDTAWDVQEAIKKTLEQFTGYDVKAVNINVQGIYFQDKPVPSTESVPEEEKPAAYEASSPVSEPFVDAEDEEEAEASVKPEKPIPPEVEQL